MTAKTEYEEETRPATIRGFQLREPVVEYVGIVHEARVPTERIIAGQRISSGKRTCWPAMFSWHTEAGGISGSIGYMDFRKISFDILSKHGYEERDKDPIDFFYKGKSALMIGMFGIEPAGVERLRQHLNWGDRPAELVLESLLNQLTKIANEREIPLLAVQTGSLYSFYPGWLDRVTPTSLVREIYNSQETPICGFRQFTTKEGKELELVSVREKGDTEDHVCLYGVIEKTFNKGKSHLLS